MQEFLQRLRSAWLFLRYTPYVDTYDHEDYWTQEDARAYSNFMRSPTGQKLANRAANLVTKSAVNATRASNDPTYACAWANGVAATFTWLDGHRGPEKERPAMSPEDEAFAERFSA